MLASECPYSTPAHPAKNAAMTNTASLYRVTLSPTDSAAMRLSRMAMMARPYLERFRFSITATVSSTSAAP